MRHVKVAKYDLIDRLVVLHELSDMSDGLDTAAHHDSPDTDVLELGVDSR